MAGDETNESVNAEPGAGNEEPRSGSKGGKGWMMLGGLALAVILAAGIAYFALGAASPAGSGSASSDAPSAANGGGESQESNVGSDGALPPPTLGDEDAPVTMVEYSDFQCPYCGQYAREVEPTLVEEYVKDGTLKIEWRDFPYLGQESVNAALAAREAQQQGRFWEYHEKLYNNQDSVNSGAFSDENLKSLAEDAGVDPEKVEESLTSSEHEASISRDFEKGQRMGITGTPTFIVNGQTIVGAQPKEEFERVIEEAAAEAGASGD